MANITIRNIPESIFKKIKIRSQREKRSMNNELLILIENGLKTQEESEPAASFNISKETQVEIWGNLSGLWEDTRETETILEDIYSRRTEGRRVSL